MPVADLSSLWWIGYWPGRPMMAIIAVYVGIGTRLKQRLTHFYAFQHAGQKMMGGARVIGVLL